eukprot:SM000327S12478  [mRNA]  locus=s327:42257:44818:+ [translate_table: standard]
MPSMLTCGGAGRARPAQESAAREDDSAAAVQQAAAKKHRVEEEDREQAAQERRDDVALSRAEVIRRLRVLKHPATLFGEDEPQRLARLKVPAAAHTRGALAWRVSALLQHILETGQGRSEPRKEKAKDKERPEGDQGEGHANAEADADGSRLNKFPLVVLKLVSLLG